MNRVLKAILAIALLLVVLSTVQNFRFPYETYTAEISEIRKTITGNGYILRGETVIRNDSIGVFEPMVKDGVRVSGGSIVGTVISGDLDEELAKKLEDVTRRIEQITRAGSITDLYASDEARIYGAVKEISASIRLSVAENNYSKAGEYKNQLDILASKKESENSAGARDRLLVSLENEKYKLEEQIGGIRTEITAPAPGFFYENLDGLEGYGSESKLEDITIADINSFHDILDTFSKSRSEIAKISDSYMWFMTAVISEEDANLISKGESIKISIDEQEPVNAEILTNSIDSGEAALVIKSDRSVQGIMEKREVSFEIEKEYHRGLSVPAEAVCVKNDVTGVYVADENKSVSFKCIDILFIDDDIYIVRDKYVPPEDVKYSSLKIYDKIILNPEAVKDYGKDKS